MRRALLAGVLLLAAACSGSQSAAPPSSTTTTVAFRAGVLERIAARAEAHASTCFLVARDGRTVFERHFRGTSADAPQEIFSATKSFTSVLVGIAQDDGDLRLGDSASRWIPEWKGTPSEAVTVRDLLSNTSGRHWSTTSDYIGLIAARDRTAYGIGLGQDAPPGQVWAYNNAAIQTLEQVLERATGESVASFATTRLFRPLGMTHTRMTTDRAGNTLTFMGIRSTCDDLARFGTLLLDHGRWKGKQLVSSAYLDEATGRSSSALNAAYGYLFWLNREGVIADPSRATSVAAAADPSTHRGQYAPGAPADMYWAIGLGNQVIQVDPGSRTVVVRLGAVDALTDAVPFGAEETSKVVTEALPQR